MASLVSTSAEYKMFQRVRLTSTRYAERQDVLSSSGVHVSSNVIVYKQVNICVGLPTGSVRGNKNGW